MAKKGQFTAESVARRLGGPTRYQWPRQKKRAAWIDATLWRVAVEPWKGDFEEVGVALRDPEEFAALGDVMRKALMTLRSG
jgi:hypothetical protein